MVGTAEQQTNESSKTITVSVKDLVRFVCQRGGLADPFSSASVQRARRGTQGHQYLQRRRPAEYRPEVPLVFEVPLRGVRLRIQGRVDGIFLKQRPLMMEEIKTVTRRWRGQANPVHWAQLRCYAAVYARDHNLSEVALRLTYFHLESQAETRFDLVESRTELEAFFQATVDEYQEWVQAYYDWSLERNESLARLVFPFESRRRGQDELMAAVDQALTDERRLFVEAATGLGKTISILFPVLKQMAGGSVDKIFSLSAKNTGKTAMLKALSLLRDQGLRLRTLNLKSRLSTCVRDGSPCQLDTCPLAVAYYDRRKPALREALETDALDGERLREIGDRHGVCPFELALDAGQFCDLILCDYHYVFDQQLLFDRYLRSKEDRLVALVDECHNLVERGRDIYSVTLATESVMAVLESMGRDGVSGLVRAMRGFLGLFGLERRARNRTTGRSRGQQLSFSALLSNDPSVELTDPEILADGFVSEGVPERVLGIVRTLVQEMEQWLALELDVPYHDELLALYFEWIRFVRSVERDGTLFRCRVVGRREPELRLLCMDPAKLLAESMEVFSSTVLFSGTLSPLPLYRQLLGGVETDPCLELGTPFDPRRLLVCSHPQIDTRYRQRQQSGRLLAERILSVVAQSPGRYFVFFPSFDYLQQIAQTLCEALVEQGQAVAAEYSEVRGGAQAEREELLKARFEIVEMPRVGLGEKVRSMGVEMRCQTPGMTDSERDDFIQNISCSEYATVIRFVVLGGLFGESIELPKVSLQGVIVVGVGYPKVSVDRDLLEAYFRERSMDGLAIAYQVPGLNRVVQAAGRLLRSESDRGVLVLIDPRYALGEYQEKLPSWWCVRAGSPERQLEWMQAFWSGAFELESGGQSLGAPVEPIEPKQNEIER